MKLDKFFRVTDEFALPNGELVEMRVLSDFDIRVRDDEALKAAGRVTRAFNDKESSEYKSRVSQFETSSDESLRSLLVAIRAAEIQQSIVNSIQPRVIPLPDGAEDDERLAIEDERSKELERVNERRRAMMEADVEAYRTIIADMDHDSLMARVTAGISSPYARAARTETHVNWTLYLSTDGKLTVEMLENMHPRVKEVLWEKYLELDNIDPFTLSTLS